MLFWRELKHILPFSYFFFIVNELEAFYEMKLFDIAANRPPQYLKNKFNISKTEKDNLEYKQIDNIFIFEVKNKHKQTEYNVDLDLGICLCPQGNTGFPCKHQIVIALDLKMDLNLCLPTTEEIRKKIHIIASGNSDIKNGWYGSADNKTKCVTDNNVNENAHTSTITQTTENNQIQCIADSQDISQSYDQVMNDFNDAIEKMKSAFDSDKEYFLPSIKSFVNSFPYSHIIF